MSFSCNVMTRRHSKPDELATLQNRTYLLEAPVRRRGARGDCDLDAVDESETELRNSSPPPRVFPGSADTVAPGPSDGLRVRENTYALMPGILPQPYLRVSLPADQDGVEFRKDGAKSISGSMTIQSFSPFGPAMDPSRLIATEYERVA